MICREAELYEIEKYEAGMEDGYSCMFKYPTCSYKNPKGLYKQCDECTLDIEKKPYIKDIMNGKTFLEDSDYILFGKIIEGIQLRSVISKEEFESKYEIIGQ